HPRSGHRRPRQPPRRAARRPRRRARGARGMSIFGLEDTAVLEDAPAKPVKARRAAKVRAAKTAKRPQVQGSQGSFRERVQESWIELKEAPGRSFLQALGVMLGVASVLGGFSISDSQRQQTE